MRPQHAKHLNPNLATLVDLLAEFVVEDFFRELEQQEVQQEARASQEQPHDPA